MKATAQAYAIQGLIKYHGLKDQKLRIPYHDSISVCMKSLATVTTVSFDRELRRDVVRIDGRTPPTGDLRRISAVLNPLRQTAGKTRVSARVESRNPELDGKGLGFSASGFAALGVSASKALGLQISNRDLSQVVRLGAGSAARSLVGGFSIWYANRNGLSYAEQLAGPDSVRLRTIIAPLRSSVKTDSVHVDSVASPLYRARLGYLKTRLREMRRAIAHRDVPKISRLAEQDTLSLHAVTMTGPRGMVLFSPASIAIIDEVKRLRDEDSVPVWFSLDTGPSVFINTLPEEVARVRKSIGAVAGQLLVSSPGGPAKLLDRHLF